MLLRTLREWKKKKKETVEMRKEEEHLISTASKMYRVRMHRIVINDVERDDDRFPYSIWLGTAAWKKKEKEKKNRLLLTTLSSL